MVSQSAAEIRTRQRLQSVVIVVLALLFLPAILYLIRVPVGIVLIMGLNLFCPCIASTCADCACDACVLKVLGVLSSVFIAVPLLFYILVHRRPGLR